MRPLRTGPALFMLLLVSTGLFTMHTLGHFSAPGSVAHGATSAVSAETAAHSEAADVMAVGSIGDAEATYLASTPPHQPSMPMGSAAACVAVLCGLIIWAMAAVLTRRNRIFRESLRLTSRAVMDAVRGPPTVPIGLSIADLSVARN